MSRWLLCVSVAALCGLAGCNLLPEADDSPGNPLRITKHPAFLKEDPQTLERIMVQRMPQGSPVYEAEKFLAQCGMRPVPVQEEGAQILRTAYRDSSSRWRQGMTTIDVHHQNGVVTQVKVRGR